MPIVGYNGEYEKEKKYRVADSLRHVVCAAVWNHYAFDLYIIQRFDSSVRSESVTESLKQEVKDRLENTPEGVALSERIKGIVIRFSPYGSDWNANVRKLAHFSIYFALASMIYITLAILGCKKLSRIFLTVLACGVFAVFDELHQGDVMGRTMSKRDVLIDMLGACTAIGGLTVISIVYSLISWVGKGIFES